jgi:predicted HicB family RNase H-like nuclease
MTKPGQFRIRLPKGLYAHLVIRARREGRSLNSLVVSLLAPAVNYAATSD